VNLKFIVLDANILIRSVFGVKVGILMQSFAENACFLTPDVCLEDAQKYIPKIATSKGIDMALAKEGFERVLNVVEMVPASLYSQYQSEAIKRIKQRDLDDWPILATAMLFNCPIWTEDRDFFGTGLPTWTSDRVHLYFQAKNEL
jgi:predicted nucleic acid-binding protein